MCAHDTRIIDRFVERLYLQSTITVVVATILGLVGGVSAGYARGVQSVSPALCLGLLGGAVGLGLGLALSIRLRAYAQIVLCLAQIERNTRELKLDASALENLCRE